VASVRDYDNRRLHEPNGAEAFFGRLDRLRLDVRALGGVTVAAMAPDGRLLEQAEVSLPILSRIALWRKALADAIIAAGCRASVSFSFGPRGRDVLPRLLTEAGATVAGRRAYRSGRPGAVRREVYPGL